jgi:hypothetical protein
VGRRDPRKLLPLGLASVGWAAVDFGRRIFLKEHIVEQEPILFIPDTGGGAEDSCQVFFYGDYHFCGGAPGGWIQCCLGELH